MRVLKLGSRREAARFVAQATEAEPAREAGGRYAVFGDDRDGGIVVRTVAACLAGR